MHAQWPIYCSYHCIRLHVPVCVNISFGLLAAVQSTEPVGTLAAVVTAEQGTTRMEASGMGTSVQKEQGASNNQKQVG